CKGCKDPDLQYIHQLCVNKFVDSLPSSSSSRNNNSQYDPENNYKSNPREYFCTRCKDDYVVLSKPISPFIILLKDKFLCYAMFLMTISVLVLTYYCVLLVKKTGKSLFLEGEEYAQYKITSLFSLGMLLFSHATN
ncbi:hypothetical protein HK099_003442, partial [Clydaea vesicula]